MITEVPTSADLELAGTDLLNLAWDGALSVARLFYEATEGWEDLDEIQSEFWAKAARPLAASLALAQQGTELLLKAKLAGVSPYILLTAPKDWAQKGARKDVPFASLRTVDAQDLVCMHDALISPPLSESFRSQFGEMRRLRNQIFHSVGSSSSVTARSVVVATLESSLALCSRGWLQTRREYLERGAKEVIYSLHEGPGAFWETTKEFDVALRLLEPDESNRLLGVQQSDMRYYCIHCENPEVGLMDHSRAAVLTPNTSESKILTCLICQRQIEVYRELCAECGADVHDAGLEPGTCLSCGSKSGSISPTEET